MVVQPKGGEPSCGLGVIRDVSLDLVALFDAHYDDIVRFLKRRRLNPALADELAQRTFVEAWRCRATYDPTRASPRAWLFGIAVNLMGRQFRDQRTEWKAHRALAGAQALAFDEGEIDAAVQRVDARAIRHTLDQCLALLSRPHYEVLTLYAWADLTQREIAAALGIPEGTVKSRLSAARAQMREILQASFLEQRNE